MSGGRGLFVTFEGLDGSGKSTHLRRLAERLRAGGRDVVVTREPGGTALGSRVREIFLVDESAPADGVVEALLMFADRRQHLREVVEPALARGAVVLSDRFSDSSFAYQGFGRELGLEALLALDRLATGGFRPARTVLFDLSPEAARGRGQSSSRRDQGAADRLDTEALEFYRRVRQGYLELAQRDPARYRVVASGGEVEATWQALCDGLVDLFEELR